MTIDRYSSCEKSLLKRQRARRKRKGVILLVVLSILVLFVLMTVTFVLVATKELGATKEVIRNERSGDSPKDVLDAIALTLFRDTNDMHSPFRSCSLLEGIYGASSFRGTIGSAAQPLGGGQMISFTVLDNSGAQPSPAAFVSGTWTYLPGFGKAPVNYYRGCVLTMITGKLVGCSTRIVASTPTSLTVMQFQPDTTDGSGNVPPPEFNSPNGFSAAFVVNAPAYSGMGRGYTTDMSKPACGALDPNGWEYALLPNPAFFQANGAYTDPAGPGGDNPDYTACDYNSIYLATVGFDATGKLTVIPSFHRPDLTAYWLKKAGPSDDLARKILFRPYGVDHPVFAQSTNPNFNATTFNTTYDVDNLGLGTPDSIWIDPGYPVMTSRDGKTYKVLVAPLILDMDGRLNLNAAGSYTQADTNFQPQFSGPLAGSAAANQTVTLPTGMGTGPAEVNPVQSQLLSQTDFQAILKGNGNYQGRHGTGSAPIANRPLTTLRFFDHPPSDYRIAPATSYGSPPDLKGRHAVGVDLRGQPMFLVPNNNYNYFWQGEVFGSDNIDNPYGIDLGLRVPRPGRQVPQGLDNPFTVAELERVLRQYDSDAPSMPVRLYNLINNSLTSNPSLALKLTVESWDVANPSLAVSKELRSSMPAASPTALNFIDLIKAKLSKTGVTSANVPNELVNILPPEVFAGQKMDINRPLGNGRNNRAPANITGSINAPYPPIPVTANSDHGIVDEVLDGGNEAIVGDVAQQAPPAPLAFWPSAYLPPGGQFQTHKQFVQFNLTNGPGASDPLIANNSIPTGWKQRQLMARYLYVMMMAFSDPTYTKWFDSTKDPQAAAHAQELTSRRIAQWAINAVCYRDSTSAMIPFVYHSQIFQNSYTGWQVNGDPGDSNQSKSISDWRVVWGCKPPDLLLTESLAFHDLRVADTDQDDGKKKKVGDSDPAMRDPDYDQTRVPQGSLFIELYSCRNPNNPIAPGDLYSLTTDPKTNQPTWMLDLGRMGADGVNPVWRMAISKSKGQNPQADMVTQLQSNPETVCAVSSPNDTGLAVPPIAISENMFDNAQVANIERLIWLGDAPPPAGKRDAVFYNRNKSIGNKLNCYMSLGGYALVGPRADTYIGSLKPNGTMFGKHATQAIIINPTADPPTTGNSAVASAGTDLNNSPVNAKPTLGVIVAAESPTTWTKHPQGIGVSVSEPLPSNPAGYYPEPLVNNPDNLKDSATNAAIIDTYGDPQAMPATPTPLDKPLETSPRAQLPNCPLITDGINKTGSVQSYRTVFLQRLADPTLPFDPLRNPYVTVDWMPIDITVFNGEEAPDANSNPPMGVQSGNPDDQAAVNPQVKFYSRQRGGSDKNNPPTPKTYNVWTPVNQGDAFPIKVNLPTGDGNFPYQAGNTLGYLNLNYGPGRDNLMSPPQYLGDPPTPFPWITWNARPYISAAELLLVPASSPDRLLVEFASLETPSPTTAAVTGYQPYDPAQPNVRGPFPYLLNFFNSSDTTYATGQASNYYRIFDYVQVPSKFIGTETILNPSVFSTTSQPVSGVPLMPPFNTISNYRDPGRININTVGSQEVWNALLNQNNNSPKPSYSDWVDSRRGDGAGGGVLTTANTSLPTSFANPLRSASSADLVPLASMLSTGATLRRGVDVTLLRPRPGAGSSLPLFMNSAMDGSDKPYIDAARNPYFAYQTLQRIDNNVTGRSNVFAVWLTIGYFEVIPNQPGIDKGHPDGYQLGAELGSDTGTIERHRAFYMFDRSIPVAYERGMNHNVNRAILLKRFIE